MTDAVKPATAWAWRYLDAVRLEAGVYSGNGASARVLEKAGYALESTARRRVFKDGKFYDYAIYVADRPVRQNCVPGG